MRVAVALARRWGYSIYMGTELASSRKRVAKSIRNAGVVKDARALGRAIARIPVRTQAERVEFGWDMLRWTLHITAMFCLLAAAMNLIAGGLIETVGWVTLAVLSNRAAVNLFVFRVWLKFRHERRVNLAAARVRVRANRKMVRRSRRTQALYS